MTQAWLAVVEGLVLVVDHLVGCLKSRWVLVELQQLMDLVRTLTVQTPACYLYQFL